VSKLVIGCGYLGLRVARLWRDAGERVFVTSRKAERRERLRAEGFEPVAFDVLEPSALPEALAAVTCVGLDRAGGADMRRVYVEGLANTLDALPGSPRLVHVSSTSVYGQSGGVLVDESSETAPADESGRIVLEAERLLRQRRPGAVVLRFAGIYGPGRLLREAAVRAGEPIPGDPDKWLNLIHVADGAAAVVAAASLSAGMVYNVVDERPVRRKDFYGALARLLGAPPVCFAPAGPEPADRRVCGARLRADLGLALRYPDYERGLADSLGG
jgi:nucleoside-diphosphate-sugar epimerase